MVGPRPASWPVFDRPEDIQEHLKNSSISKSTRDGDGNTLIHHAKNDWEVLALVRAGVDINAKNRDGKTAFDEAFARADDEAMRALELNGALSTVEIAKQEKAEYLWQAAGVNFRTTPFPIFQNEDQLLEYYSDPKNDPNVRDKAGNTHLFYARSDWEVRALIGCGVPVNARSHHGMTVLDVFTAVDGGNDSPRVVAIKELGGKSGPEVVKLVEQKQKERKEYEDYLASIQAPRAGQAKAHHNSVELSIASAILTEHKLINKVQVVTPVTWNFKADKEGNTDLHRIASLDPKQALSVIRQAQKEGVDINLANNKGQTALHRVLNEGKCEHRQELVSLLVKNGSSLSSRDERGHSAGHLSVRYPEIFRELGKIDPRIVEHRDKIGGVPLHLVRTAEQVRAVLSVGDPKRQMEIQDQKGRNPIHVAPSGQVTAELLANGDDPMRRSKDGYTPGHYAISEGSLRVLKAAGADLNDRKNIKGFSILHMASNAEVAGWLDANGHKNQLGQRDRQGYTPEAHINQEEILLKLLSSINQNSRCANDQRTPAMSAAINGLMSDIVLEALQEHRFRLIGVQNARGDTLLHGNTKPEAVGKLAKIDPAAINGQNKSGITPLGMAKTAQMVKALLDVGADPKIKDNRGLTMTQVLAERGIEIPTDAITRAEETLRTRGKRESEQEEMAHSM